MRSIIWLALRCQRKLTFQESWKIEIVKIYLMISNKTIRNFKRQSYMLQGSRINSRKYTKQKGSPKYKLKRKRKITLLKSSVGGSCWTSFSDCKSNSCMNWSKAQLLIFSTLRKKMSWEEKINKHYAIPLGVLFPVCSYGNHHLLYFELSVVRHWKNERWN